MIDLDSANDLSRAAWTAHEMITDQIAADPHGPIVAELQELADDLEALVKDNNNTIRILQRKTR